MICPSCANEADDIDRYCRSCGHPLTPQIRLPDESTRILTFDNEAYLLATFWRRLAAVLIDGVVIYLAYGAVITFVLMSGGYVDESDPDALVAGVLSALYLVHVILTIPLVAIFCVYHCIGWSPGKGAVGLRIVRWDGGRPGLRHGLIRYAATFLSAFVFYLGFLWVFWDRYRQGWHDKAAQTYVIRVPSEFAFRPPVTDESIAASPGYVPGPRGPLRRGIVSATIAAILILLMTGCGLAVNWSSREGVQEQWERSQPGQLVQPAHVSRTELAAADRLPSRIVSPGSARVLP